MIFMRSSYLRNPIATLTTFVVLVATAAQEKPATAPPGPKLNIVIVNGGGDMNYVKQRTRRETIVMVEDENHRPIAGASVLFALPQNGASGAFTANGSKFLTVVTGPDGRATAAFKPIGTGNMPMNVTASSQGQSATVSIPNTVTAAPVMASGLIVAVIAAAAGVAGVSTYLARRNGDKPSVTGGRPIARTP